MNTKSIKPALKGGKKKYVVEATTDNPAHDEYLFIDALLTTIVIFIMILLFVRGF